MQSAAQRELARRNPESLLDWTLAYRTIRGKPMRLIPALQDLYRDTHPFIVVQKGAQVFVTEYLINSALWVADTAHGSNGTALYVMPTAAQVKDFSQARVDRAIGESEYLCRRIAPPPPGRAGPVRQGLKKVGDGYVYFRGSDAAQLISVPADAVFLDEYDLMNEDVLPRARQLLAASSAGIVRIASTPRFPEAGINMRFLDSDQRYFFLKCAACGREQRLEWAHNIDPRRKLVVCRFRSCRKPLDLWGPGHWEATVPGNERVHGYHISRLYSPLANLEEMIWDSAATTPWEIQEFQNSVLGETFSPPGGRISYGDLDAARGEYTMPGAIKQESDMGVDVGTKLHVVIRSRPDSSGRTRALFIGELASFDELSNLVARYNVRCSVVDAQPETRQAKEFARKQRRVWLAHYDRGGDHDWASFAGESGTSILHLNRTMALDEMFERFRERSAELPGNARVLGGRVRDGYGEYYREMAALTRTLEQDALGNWTSRYIDARKPDHYAHAEVYCLFASKRLPGARFLGFIEF